METKQKHLIKSYTVPMDLLMDILKIIFKDGLKHYIEGINETDGSLILRIYFQPNSSNDKGAKNNIEEILSDYGYYLNSAFNSLPDFDN